MSKTAADIQAAMKMAAGLIPVWTRWAESVYDERKEHSNRAEEHTEACHLNCQGCDADGDGCKHDYQCTCGGDDRHAAEWAELDAQLESYKDSLLDAQIAVDEVLRAAYGLVREEAQQLGLRIVSDYDRSFYSKYLTISRSDQDEEEDDVKIRFSDHPGPVGRGGRYQHPETGEVVENSEASYSVHPAGEYHDGGTIEGALSMIRKLAAAKTV